MEGLILWLIVFLLLISSLFGKIGNKIAGKKGEHIGFAIPFLLTICIVAYNIAEYYYIKNQVQTFCQKEAGIFVYVTPEQWREQNKDELDSLYQFDDREWEEVKSQVKEIEKEYPDFVYESNKYKNRFIYNERIVQYRRREKINYFVSKLTDLTIDIKTGQVLAKAVYNNSGVSGFMSINHWSDLKEWMNNIPNCRYIGNQFIDLSDQFSNRH